MEFIRKWASKRDVSGSSRVKTLCLLGLLSVRYTLVAKDADSNWQGEGMDGFWDLLGSTSAYQIYEAQKLGAHGFCQQYYVCPISWTR